MGKHEQIKYEYIICGKSSDSKRSLSVHIKHHTDRFPCQSCHKIFASKSSLNNHQRIHMRQEDTCKKCQKSFKSRKSYLDHVSYGHTDEPVVQCYYCGKYFWNPTQGDNHVQVKHKHKMTPIATVSKAPDEGNPTEETTSAAGDPGATGIVEQTTAEPTETLEAEPTETFELESVLMSLGLMRNLLWNKYCKYSKILTCLMMVPYKVFVIGESTCYSF